MSTVLITGTSGFIGQGLAVSMAENHKVICMSRKNPNLELPWVRGEFGSFEDLRQLDDEAIDVVVHLAAQGSVQKSFTDVGYNNAQNIDGYLNVLTVTGQREIPEFIYASSCAIYGDCEDLPITEAHCPDPISPYASSKLINDLLSRNLAHLYPKTRMTGLRFFNIFGPWQDPYGDYSAVIPKWIDMCLAGRQPVIFGDGGATRDFCYVGNICDLIESLGRAGAADKGGAGVFNVASEVPTSLNELFTVVTDTIKARGVDLPFEGAEYRLWPEGDIVHSLGSIELVRRELGFEPKVDLADGIMHILSEQYGL